MLDKLTKGLLALAIAGGLSVTGYAAAPTPHCCAADGTKSEDCAESCDKAPCQLTDEQKAELISKAKQHLSQKLADGEITQEQYDKALSALENWDFPFLKREGHGGKDKPNLTDEQKAELIEKAKQRLSQRLADGKITQEQYDKALSLLEEGKLPLRAKHKSEKAQ